MTEAVERLATACELPAAQIPPRMTYRTGSSNGSAEIWGPEETTEGWTGQTLAVAILAADPALAAALELGLAWQEAEAALPEGWAKENLQHTAMMDQRWQAEAGSRIGPVIQWNKVRTVIAEGPTPAAALRALAARLREAKP